MSTMKAARFPSAGKSLELVEVPIPEPGEGQVRIRVHVCGICHSDEVVHHGGLLGTVFPRIPGHEIAGEIDKLGEGVKNFKKGDRVGLGWFGGHCGSCANCLDNCRAHCSASKVTGAHYDGGYAQYTVCNSTAVARIPDDLSYEEAGPFMCAGLTVFNSMRNQGIVSGSLVAIQGVGGLGHLAIQFASKMGFRVVALSTGDDKEQLAKEMGAKYYINTNSKNVIEELKKLGGAALIVATAPIADAINSLVNGLKVGGKLLVVAAPKEGLTVHAGDLLRLRASVSGWLTGDSKDAEDTLLFAMEHDVHPKIEVFPLEQVQEAYDKMLQNKVRFRSVIKMP